MRVPVLLAAARFMLTSCGTPDHAVQADTIQADVQQTFGGDEGALIYHGYEAARLAEAAEAARLAEAAEAARDQLASLPSYSPADINLSNRANEIADQAAEHRRQADAALNRILDPLRQRITKLEQSQAATGAAALSANLKFAPGSAALSKAEVQKLAAVANYLARSPHALVVISSVSEGTGAASRDRALSRARANAVYDALIVRGVPNETSIAVIEEAVTDGHQDQPAKIEVRPQG
jgi:outer membrane protein OmpA-like peptidoglycan-associated protein